MKTKRLFKENTYLCECDAKIIEKNTLEGHTAVIFDQSVFFPEGGGQPWDLGKVIPRDDKGRTGKAIPILKVIENEGEILNVLDTSDDIPEGTNCHLVLDWDRRFDNMQRHTGEHIFTGVFDREFGGTNRGFHMGDDYMTIDIALEDRAKVDSITWDMVKQAELLSRELVLHQIE